MSTRVVTPLLGLAFLLASILAQDKWVWNGKTAKAVRTESGRLRYGIYDPDGLDDYQGVYRPGLRPPPPDLPPLVRPSRPGPDYPRPPPPPLPQRPSDKTDLDDPTRFKICKCVHAFNCKSPGLLFGSCDAGKKYCCEKSVHGGGSRDFVPDNQDPEVLAGPGGPVDHLKKPVPGPHGDRPPRPAPGPYGDRPGPGLGAYGDGPARPGLGAYGNGPDRPGLGAYGDLPSRPGTYGIRPDGSLGAGAGGDLYRPGPRY